jgi:predicted phosphoadenosine phosphosulfate sulfurtransferase
LLDLESQYDATINHALEIIDNNLDILEPYWVALPLHLRNAVSVFEPNRKCRDEEKKDIRVRQRPDRDYVISDPNYFPFFRD